MLSFANESSCHVITCVVTLREKKIHSIIAGGFGSVFKGNFGNETLIAVKKLERILPHGEKEFVTEVNTIGSMHHMNLVRLIGFCSEGSQRYMILSLDYSFRVLIHAFLVTMYGFLTGFLCMSS